MEESQKIKTIKVHRGLALARWAWIFIAGVSGTIMRNLRENDLSLFAAPPKIDGITIVQVFAYSLVIFNILLTIYVFSKFFNKRITPFGFKILNFLQVYVDLVVFIGFFYFTGGIETPGMATLFLPLIISLIIYRQTGIIITALTTILFFSLAVASQYYAINHGASFLPHYHAYKDNAYHLSDNLIITIYFYYNFIMTYLGAAIFGSLASKIIKNYENELIIERDKTSSAINSLTEGVITYTADNKISFVNPMAESLTQVREKDVINQPIDESLNKVSPLLHKILSLSPSRKKEIVTVEKPNNLIMQVSTVSINDIGGKPIGYMKIIQDITREKEIDRLKTEFISVVSHQLRTPLSAIKWAIKMMLDKDLGPTTKEQEKFLRESFDSNEQMIRLVNDLLNISRIEEGKFSFEFEDAGLEDVTEETIKESSLIIEKMKARNINFKFHKPSVPMPTSKIDKEKLKLAILNLIENANNYTKQGSVEITVWPDEKEKTNNFSIKDTGVGIPEQDKQNIFKKFFRAGNISKASQGTGLGLFLVKNLIEKHGGEISFQSKKDKGTTFTFKLPALEVSREIAEKQKTAKFNDLLKKI